MLIFIAIHFLDGADFVKFFSDLHVLMLVKCLVGNFCRPWHTTSNIRFCKKISLSIYLFRSFM